MADPKVAGGTLDWPLFGVLERGFLEQLVSRLKDGTQAEDLAQEVYLRLLRSDRSLLIQNPRQYAARVASNVACEWGRLARHQRPHLEDTVLDAHETEYVSPEEQAALDQQLARVDQVLSALPDDRRAAVLMRLRDGAAHAEIADRMGVSLSTVYKHLSLGLGACQQALREGGSDPAGRGRDRHRKRREAP